MLNSENEPLKFKIEDVYYLENLEQFEAIAAPFRYKIIKLISIRPITGAQLAKILGISRPRAHYHLKTLEKQGLVNLVEKRLVKGIIENYYLSRAKFFSADKLIERSQKNPEDTDFTQNLYKIINKTALTMLEAAHENLADSKDKLENYTFSFEFTLGLTHEQIKELENEYNQLANKIYKMGRENGKLENKEELIPYRNLLVMLPLPPSSNVLAFDLEKEDSDEKK